MSEAVFGLVGVVVGALLSGSTEWLLARRREQRSARTAARVVRDEMYLVAAWLEDLSSGEWTVPADWRYDAAVWNEQRIHLATVLPYEGYARAQRAHHTASRFSTWIAQRSSDTERPSPPQLDMWLRDLREGLQALLEIAR